MRRCHQHRAAAQAAAASVTAGIISYVSSRISPSSRDNDNGAHHARAWQQYPWRSSDLRPHRLSSPPLLATVAYCEEKINNRGTDSNEKHAEKNGKPVANRNTKVNYDYMKMEPNDLERTFLDSHAVFGALWGDSLIERYDVYRRVSPEGMQQQNSSSSKQELTVVDLRIGSRLNGHGGVVHGGIISLLFDEAMGWAYECLQEEDDKDSTSTVMAVTANLTVDFRAPFMENSEAMIRVYHDETIGRKIYFSATLESNNGSVIFAEAKSLFVVVKSHQMKAKL